MIRTNTNEYMGRLREYLIPIINEKAECYEMPPTDKPFTWAIEMAKSEVPNDFERKGRQEGLKHWLQGIAIDIAYNNGDIVDVLEKLHGCTLTDRQIDVCLENWFAHIAFKIIQFSEKECK